MTNSKTDLFEILNSFGINPSMLPGARIDWRRMLLLQRSTANEHWDRTVDYRSPDMMQSHLAPFLTVTNQSISDRQPDSRLDTFLD